MNIFKWYKSLFTKGLSQTISEHIEEIMPSMLETALAEKLASREGYLMYRQAFVNSCSKNRDEYAGNSKMLKTIEGRCGAAMKNLRTYESYLGVMANSYSHRPIMRKIFEDKLKRPGKPARA